MRRLAMAACIAAMLVPGIGGLGRQWSEASASEGGVVLPGTIAGDRAAAYFRAFNSGSEDSVRKFFEENVTKSSLEARPIEDRLAIHRRLKGDLGTLTPVKIVTAAEDALTVIAHSSTDKWVQMVFDLEKEPPQGITGMGIRLLPAPPDLDEPTTPLTRAQLQVELRAYVDTACGQRRLAPRSTG